jgi:DNA-binding response OmpR family regulator
MPTDLPVRILVVEDHDDSREALRALLEVAGYLVADAKSSNDVFPLLPVFVPDIIILDLLLPGMSGLAIASRIRSEAKAPQPYILCFSGAAELEKRSREVGCDDFVLKPADADTLRAKLESVCAQRFRVTGDR